MARITRKIYLAFARLKARFQIVWLIINRFWGLKQGWLLPLIIILMIFAMIMGILSSSSILAPFVYPLF